MSEEQGDGGRSPQEYIRLTCELHVAGGRVILESDASQAALAAFLAAPGSDVISGRLFVAANADASNDMIDNASLVFVRNVAVEVKSRLQIQLITIKRDTSSAVTTGLVPALSLYTSQCFLPALLAQQQQSSSGGSTTQASDAQAALLDKLRQLDVALQQSKRSAKLPHVQLPTHPTIAAAVASSGNQKPSDLAKVGLDNPDDELLNELQTAVNGWTTQIRQLTSLALPAHLEPCTNVVDEVAFWQQLAVELEHVQHELQRPEVELTLTLLRNAKRVVAVIALDNNNTGLDEAITIVTAVNAFLKDLPLHALQTSPNLTALNDAMNAFFAYVPKMRTSRAYSLERTCQLVEASTAVIHDRIVELLETQFPNMLLMDHGEYQNKIRFPCDDLFAQLREDVDEFKAFLLDNAKRRRLEAKPIMEIAKHMKMHHGPLQERLEHLHDFRAGHEHLRQVVHTVLRQEDPASVQLVEQAPRQIFAKLDVLDLSDGGSKELEAAWEEYDIQMDALEEHLARLLRDKLTACRDAEDMFRVFSRFNLLLTRNRVRAAVKEFQMQLIDTVAQAVAKLQTKFTQRYEDSATARLSHLKGIPPVSGKIMWAKQMERQVQLLMSRMGQVLGPNWGQLLEGRQLRKSGDELLAKLDSRAFVRNWVNDWETDMVKTATSRLSTFPILIEHDPRDGSLFARVNFEPRQEVVYKEIRQLKWLGFGSDITQSLQKTADEAQARFPTAMILKTAIRSYQSVRRLITPELEPLVMPHLVDIREIVAEAFDIKLSSSTAVATKGRIKWESSEVHDWAIRLADKVTKFEERVEQLLRACDKVDIALNVLEKVAYDGAKFAKVIEAIQNTIDQMSLNGYSNLESWVNVVCDQMADVLAKRLVAAVVAWNNTFRSEIPAAEDETGRTRDGVESEQNVDVANQSPVPEFDVKIKVEIVLRNQEILAVPPVESGGAVFLKTFHDLFAVVSNLARPTSGRYEVFDEAVDGISRSKTFDSLKSKVPAQMITDAYAAIEDHVALCSDFVSKWLKYQALWDKQVSEKASELGGDVELWQSALQEAADSRSTLDTTATFTEFGPILVKYGKVQSQINLKYDAWQREMQSSFANVLGQKISEVHIKISSAKEQLEETAIENVPTEKIVIGVTFIQEVKQRAASWAKEIFALSSAEALLKKQRHAFHSEWMEVSMAQGIYQNFLQILDRRCRSMEQQIPVLQTRIAAEDKSAGKQAAELFSRWEAEKPLRGNLAPPNALEMLSSFEVSLGKAHRHQQDILRAKDALRLESSMENIDIIGALNELSDIKEVWNALVQPHADLERIKDTLWSTAVMRKVRRGLEDLLASMRALPNRIRQYEACIQLHDEVKLYIKEHGLLADLKTEALKERHWKTILQRLQIRVPFTDVTVGLLWDNGLLVRKKDITEILTVAQGEMALEVFLNQVRDRWTKQELELVLFQNRTRLIRGWDDLFATLDDHLGGLAQMKNSPYFRAVREFQDETKLWEDRLTSLRAAFDSWVDVQRRWVYLEGIFLGSSDIKAQLPAEWSRFKNVDSEFVALMRKIAAKPYAMEVLDIDNLQRTLDRLGNLMGTIQKALGEYLAKQRADFSRFYFLGDDDLLEIMGNSGEPGKVLAHVGKMFAGVSGARRASEGLPEGVKTRFDAMIGKDGEIVPLCNPIDITSGTSVKEWLRELESRMKTTLALLLDDAVNSDTFSPQSDFDRESFVQWAMKFPAQVIILATQINWSSGVDKALSATESKVGLSNVLRTVETKLEVMAQSVLTDLPPTARRKVEQMITELVRQRDVIRSLVEDNVLSQDDFRWQYHLRYIYEPKAGLERLRVSLSNASFCYGFEYLGIGERLVQTPLTDKCYLTLTQALHFRMGGSPFGPAGTGKTESVKALSAALGRFVLVFNCDETFDFSAMGRLLAGLSQVGAWGCFDEFNRLEERILSAVSQQILTIQRGLIERRSEIELLGRSISLHDNVGIFITMNPGYEGRSNLPDNLKNLFRSFAMVVPDRKLIAQVMLYSQGIVTAESLAGQVVDLFTRCEEYMSNQRHYDFGLRALKTLLVSAGALKRQALEGSNELADSDLAEAEKNALIVGACNNVLPKLVAEDIPIFEKILKEIFPGSSVAQMDDIAAKDKILVSCKEHNLCASEAFVQKILQLRQVVDMRHGIMVVGMVGSGKSAAVRLLAEVIEQLENKKVELYVIDPKAISKEKLYGSLDSTTLEWTDGVFTSILRRIIDDRKGESERRHWVVFDGDVDPNWVENLNSVLDDNKMLTLPSGERLSIPGNVRIMLEVDSLSHATPATVSRCGMVWFNDDCVTAEMCLEKLVSDLSVFDVSGSRVPDEPIPPGQEQFVVAIKPNIISERSDSLVLEALKFALHSSHVMGVSRDRLLHTLSALLIEGIAHVIEYDDTHPDFPMAGEHMARFAQRWLLHSLMWAFAGSAPWDARKHFSQLLLRCSGAVLPDNDGFIFEYRVRIDDGEYEKWSDSVPKMEIESHRAAASDVVITTTDTVRHSEIMRAWIARRMPFVLCGPPGSGKTMTLANVLQSIQGIVFASLNFSSRTTPEIILKTFAQYCSYVRRGKDLILEPSENFGASAWLVIFCDEINLPEEDKYGTQRVIMFMRQLVEHGGFWKSDCVWVKINRIQFLGACNPPTDAGRVEMSSRFLRHAPVLLVDFPERDSLLQIYRTFNGGLLKLFPNLRGEADAMTEAMVEVYVNNQQKFKVESQPQYFYSPRELSRWVRGIKEVVVNTDQGLTREELVRVWAHEGLRLFSDRLVSVEAKAWCSNQVDQTAQKWFAGVDFDIALQRPIFYTTWLSKDTRQVSRDELRDFLSARLRVFYEEELDVPLVIFDEVLEHVLRIDRVLRQPMGHLLLAGDAGAGKTVLSKFASWMNGLNIFQIKAHSRYGMEEFNEDLRAVMRRVGVHGERICFIFDESNVLSSGFVEAINALLASGEVPGLFDGEEYTALVGAVRDSANRDGIILDSEEELWRHFTTNVQRNLHVVFTVNPSGGEWKNRSTTSPALFNRCVVDWFGSWGYKAMGEVAREFTARLDMGDAESSGGSWGVGAGADVMARVQEAFDDKHRSSLRQAVVAALVDLHLITKVLADELAESASSNTRMFLSPRDYLTLIHNFVECLTERREQVEDEQLHINAGLDKLRQTQENVAELKNGLGAKTAALKKKEAMANEKLQQMVADQNVAERRKEDAERISAKVEKQQQEIDKRKTDAQRDLDEAEPALIDAQQSVRGIKKRDLDEIRNLARPPNNVKLTLECVAIMLGETSIEWASVRKLLAKTDFIPSIINFDADKLSSKQISQVKEEYLDGNPDLTEEAVMRSSKACGPLYKWAESQIKYSTIYNNIQPLREEVAQLESEAASVRADKAAIEEEVAQLEASIAQYKDDYASLIRDVEGLKAEMQSVTTKIDRAENLLKSLGHESERWSKSAENFNIITSSLVGDGLLMAGFLTYFGFFDFQSRHTLMRRWKASLDALDLQFRDELAIVETLSTAARRLTWQKQGLASDQLSMENGVILERSVRYPLVVDPSGMAIDFLMQKHHQEKIQKTSFLDKAFIKTLASAVRFGTALLVENVETLDPILNPLLNKELQRTGGRTLVRIGSESVDFSPKFHIILTTKNPAVHLTPDICSRVTLVNFTVTPDSLQSQSLSQLVTALRPELEQQRSELLKLQGEQNVNLRALEDQMLAKISACQGSILEDDRVVDGMELLMREGAQVEKQISQSDEIMRQVHQAVGRFEPFARFCRIQFVLLEALRELSFLYEFPPKFMAILNEILSQASKVDAKDEAARLGELRQMLLHELAARIGRGLQVEDKLVYSLVLARFDKNDFTLGTAISPTTTSDSLVNVILQHFGAGFPWEGRALNELTQVAEHDVNATMPLLLCSAPGHDVSGRVEVMARELHVELASVAMGSSEGYDTATAMLNGAAKRGSWVMLKNVHLCVDWLSELVKRVQALSKNTTHANFRLFITSEIHPKLPTALLQICDVMVAQAPTGIQATLTRFFSSIAKDRLNSSVRNRLYLLLGWTHAVIQERLRYVPIGWTEAYEFTEADALHALDVMDSLCGTKPASLDPEKLPWDAIRSTLCKSVFGGRVTEDTDQAVLDELVHALFVPQSFNMDFGLVPGLAANVGPTLPETTTRVDCWHWIESLPSHAPLTWIGLDATAEAERDRRLVQAVQHKLNVVQQKCNVELAAAVAAAANDEQ